MQHPFVSPIPKAAPVVHLDIKNKKREPAHRRRAVLFDDEDESHDGDPKRTTRCIASRSGCCILHGWHVHEPATYSSLRNRRHRRTVGTGRSDLQPRALGAAYKRMTTVGNLGRPSQSHATLCQRSRRNTGSFYRHLNRDRPWETSES